MDNNLSLSTIIEQYESEIHLDAVPFLVGLGAEKQDPHHWSRNV